jgi:hypothetical protein
MHKILARNVAAEGKEQIELRFPRKASAKMATYR